MISEADFYGRYRTTTMSADLVLKEGLARVQSVDPQFGGLNVDLPDARRLRLGGPIAYIVNVNDTNGVTVRDAAAGTVASLSTNEAAILSLVANADAGGSWIAQILSVTP
jgi:hypothetical protein